MNQHQIIREIINEITTANAIETRVVLKRLLSKIYGGNNYCEKRNRFDIDVPMGDSDAIRTIFSPIRDMFSWVVRHLSNLR